MWCFVKLIHNKLLYIMLKCKCGIFLSRSQNYPKVNLICIQISSFCTTAMMYIYLRFIQEKIESQNGLFIKIGDIKTDPSQKIVIRMYDRILILKFLTYFLDLNSMRSLLQPTCNSHFCKRS